MKQKRILIVGGKEGLDAMSVCHSEIASSVKIANEIDSLKEMGMEDIIGSVPAPRLLERFPVDDTHYHSPKSGQQKRRERRKQNRSKW
jgi:hypothetical protein